MAAKKPEFTSIKKAYSPFKVLQSEIENYSSGENLSVPVYNRFDHTNFNEISIRYRYRNIVYALNPVNIKPHSKGFLSLPIKEFDPDEVITLEAFDNENRLIDKYILCLKNRINTTPQKKTNGKTEVAETQDKLTILCSNIIKIVFDKTTGLIEQVQKSDGDFRFSGPFLNLRREGKEIDFMRNHIDDYGKGWLMKSFSYDNRDNEIIVHLKGSTIKFASVSFDIAINSSGKIYVQYAINGVPSKRIREVGIRFDFDNIIDTISWKRDAYWSNYPENYLSASVGKAPLYVDIANEYLKKPEKEWIFDTKSFYYNGTEKENVKQELTFIAKATKENILAYELFDGITLFRLLVMAV